MPTPELYTVCGPCLDAITQDLDDSYICTTPGCDFIGTPGRTKTDEDDDSDGVCPACAGMGYLMFADPPVVCVTCNS